MNEVRFSHLRAYGRSAMHGHHARTAAEDDPSYAMQRGTAVHALLFGTRKVIGYPGSVRRGKDYEAFVEMHPDHEILTMVEYEKARAMADAVRNCAVAKPVLDGAAEQTIRFNWMGLPCRATPDIRGAGFLTELKTSASAEPVKFGYHALRMHYHAQMRMQQIACGDTEQPCYIVCVESAPPYPVTVFEIEPKALELGERQLVLWAERLKNCESSGHYPAYTSAVYPILAPEEAPEYDFGEVEA